MNSPAARAVARANASDAPKTEPNAEPRPGEVSDIAIHYRGLAYFFAGFSSRTEAHPPRPATPTSPSAQT